MNTRCARLPLGILVFCSLLLGTAKIAYTATPQAPDNTAQNKNNNSPTADNQNMNPADRQLTQKIRKSIHEDKSLSNYAHNIKIITQDGKVTLRGPVRSEEERANLLAKATAVAGEGNVMNDLTIAAPK